MTEGDQNLWGTPRGRERRSQMAERVDRPDTWQPFSSLPYTPDAPTHTYISSPVETTLHLDTLEKDSDGPQKLAATSGTSFNRPRANFYMIVLCTTICD